MWLHTLCQRFTAISPAVLNILLDAAIKGFLLLLLTTATTLVMRRTSAAARHLVWFLGVLSLLVLPILSAGLPGWHILPRWANNSVVPVHPPVVVPAPPTAVFPLSPSPDTPAEVSGSGYRPPAGWGAANLPSEISHFKSTDTPQTPTPKPQTPTSSPLLLWLSGTTLFLTYIAAGFLSLHCLQRRSTRITTGPWPILLAQLRDQLNFHRPVELLAHPRRTMPMTWGLWHTRLLLPDESGWTPDQRRAVLLHELAHAKRGDCLMQFLTQLALALYWFNPLLWLAANRMKSEREQACDDLVLTAGTKPSAYAAQLLHIATAMPTPGFTTAAIAMARPSKLESRLLAILDVTRNRRSLTRWRVLIAAIAALALAIPMACMKEAKPKPQTAIQPATHPKTATDQSLPPEWLHFDQWAWLDPNRPTPSESWDVIMNRTHSANWPQTAAGQMAFLRGMQLALDAHPPRDGELLIREEMGYAMHGGFLSTAMDDQVVPWLAQMLEQSQDIPTATTTLWAKVRLAEQLHISKDREQHRQLFTRLLNEVLDTPADQVLLVAGDGQILSAKQIRALRMTAAQAAQIPSGANRENYEAVSREILERDRLDRFKQSHDAAARVLARAQWVKDDLPRTRANLLKLQQQRMDDPVFQTAVADYLADIQAEIDGDQLRPLLKIARALVASSATQPTTQPASPPTKAERPITAGDRLIVFINDVMGNNTGATEHVISVDADGRLKLPMLDKINVSGRTCAQLAADIDAAYRNANLIKNARVSVEHEEDAAPTTQPTGMPSWVQLKALLGRPIDSPQAHEFNSRYGLEEKYSEGNWGWFGSRKGWPFSFLYREQRIVSIDVLVGPYPSTSKAEFYPDLPHGMLPEDTPEDVIRRIGPPSSQSQRDNLCLYYAGEGLNFAFDKKTHVLEVITLVKPVTQPTTQPVEMPAAAQPALRLVDDPVAAIGKALPDGFIVQQVLHDAYPTRLEEGKGLGICVGRPPEQLANVPHKQDESLVVWIMPPDYPGRQPPLNGLPQEAAARKVAATPQGNIFFWGNQEDLERKVLVALLVSSPAPAQGTGFPIANDVEVSLTPEKAEVEIGEPLLVDLVYHNLGQSTYYVDEDHNGDFALHAVFRVRDEQGNPLTNPYALDLGPGSVDILTTRHTLKPGGSATITRMLNECARFPKPGTYTIDAPYTLVTGPAEPGKQPPYYTPKAIASTLRVKDYDKARRKADIDALLAAYRRGAINPDDLPFGRLHVYFGGDKWDIVRMLALFDEPRLIPFFLDVMDSEDINGYARYGLMGISDRAAVLKAYEERLDHPERYDISGLIGPYATLRFPARETSELKTAMARQAEVEDLYRDKAIAVLKADRDYRYGRMASHLCWGRADEAFLIHYLLHCKPTEQQMGYGHLGEAKYDLPREDEPLVEGWLDAKDIGLRDAAISRLILMDRVKYLPVLQADKPDGTGRFSKELHEKMDATAQTAPSTAPTNQVSATQAAVELRTVFAKALTEYRNTAGKRAEFPGVLNEDRQQIWLYRSEAMEALADRLSQQADARQLTPYLDAAAGMLGDADPATRGLACVLLGALATRTADAGLPPRLAALLADQADPNLPGLARGMVAQQSPPSDWDRFVPAGKFTVGDMARGGLLGVTGIGFHDAQVFEQWLQVNRDGPNHLWYWGRRWSGGMGDDVAYLAEHDPKHLLPIVILVQDLGCVDAECRGYPWAKYDLIGEDMFAITRHYPQPSPQAVADLVGKYHLRGQLLDMVAGEFNWPVDFDDGLKARVVTERVIPVLAAASSNADAAEIRALVRRGKGLAGSDDNVEIAIARLAVTLDPDHATDILLEQLDRNRGLAQLTSDLLKVDGVQHWGVIKSSYQKNLEKGGLIIETLATLKPAEAAPKLAELLEASPDGLAITLDHEDMPTDDDGTRDMLFDAFVKAAQAVNHGQPVLDAATATAARLEWRGKGSDPQAVAAHNRAAIAARPVAVAKLLAFFRVP